MNFHYYNDTSMWNFSFNLSSRLGASIKSHMLFISSLQTTVRTRRSDNSQQDLKLENILGFFLTTTSTKAIVKKMSSEVAQLLLEHSYQVRYLKISWLHAYCRDNASSFTLYGLMHFIPMFIMFLE
jgi:hypothetical protein